MEHSVYTPSQKVACTRLRNTARKYIINIVHKYTHGSVQHVELELMSTSRQASRITTDAVQRDNKSLQIQRDTEL